MTVLFDLNHAAHVHFVRNAFNRLTAQGHKCLITASDKPLVYQLLKEYNLPYHPMGTIGKTLFAKFFKLIVHDFKLLLFCIKHKPEVILGIVAIRGSHIGWLLGIRTIVFTDTEHATKQISIFKPFATEIHTPNWFGAELGKKQKRYSGFHELAYLHPDNFEPRDEVKSMLGVNEGESYCIIRFIAWDATHDKNQYGIDLDNKRELVNYMSTLGKVFITSEYELEDEFKQFEYSIPKSYLHDALHFASILISEGATTACEAALLGLPTVLVNTMKWGYIAYLEEEYDLVHHISDQAQMMALLEQLMSQDNLREAWSERRNKFIAKQQDTTEYIVNLITKAS